MWINKLDSLPKKIESEVLNIMKTSLEKEKMLVTSIFSFSHNVFFPIKDKNHHLEYIYFVVCKYFEFAPVYDFCHSVKNFLAKSTLHSCSLLIFQSQSFKRKLFWRLMLDFTETEKTFYHKK